MAQLAKESLSPPFDQFSDFRDEQDRWDSQASDKAVAHWLEGVQAELRKKSGDLVGEIFGAHAGDGCAQYIVLSQKPLILQHLNIGDAWSIPYAHIRGLRIADVREQIEADRRADEIFGKK